jgi:RNA polymerase sigma-70 factor (ECF subfamily)
MTSRLYISTHTPNGSERRFERTATDHAVSREREAIHQAQRGDASAFRYLYDVHSRPVYSMCRRMLVDQTEAEDQTQETFLQAFRKIRTFRYESSFSTWLHRIAINVVLMHLRKKKFTEVSLDEVLLSPRGHYRVGAGMGSASAPLNELIDQERLIRSIAQLGWNHRIVLVLHDIQGYTHQEIARLMKWSTSTSKGQLHKAHVRLRLLLQHR